MGGWGVGSNTGLGRGLSTVRYFIGLVLTFALWGVSEFNPLIPGIVVGAVHGRRVTRAAARGAPGAAWERAIRGTASV